MELIHPDDVWLASQREQYDEELRRTRLALQAIRDERGESKAFWTDACAAQMNSGYLTPLEESAFASLTELQKQSEILGEVAADLASAHFAFQTVLDASWGCAEKTERESGA